MSKELEEALRVKRVDGSITQADAQMASNDIMGAFRTIEAALRLDPTNDRLNSQMNRVKPKYEQLEKQRVAGLDPKERLKEEGDMHFKNASFEKAIVSYTKCLDSISDKVRSYNFSTNHVVFIIISIIFTL